MLAPGPSLRSAPYWPWPLLVGLFFGLLALALAPLIGVSVGPPFSRSASSVPWPLVFAGVFLCGWIAWWALVPNWSRVTPVAGAAAGVIAAALSYPTVLGLYQVIAEASDPGGAGTTGFERVVWVAGLGLMTTGFAAMMVLAVAGMIAAWFLTAVVRPPRALENRAARERRTVLPRLRWLLGAGALILVAGLAGFFAYLSLTPVPVAGLGARASPTVPARTYEEALAAFSQIREQESSLGLHERCPSQLLTQGKRAKIAVIFFHGLTSCPAQGEELARSLQKLGYNVYLPRMFGHGEADPDTVSLASLTAEHLVDLANSSVDLAQGLGDEVVVVGLSAGGTMVTWTAQHRGDVALAIPVSPFLGPYIVPPWATHAATNLLLMLPNVMFWINPLSPVTAPQTDYVFPRPSTHTLAEIMRLGEAVKLDAAATPPAASKISVLINEADVAVNNQLTRELVDLWRRRAPGVAIRSLAFSNYLPHDVVNPYEMFGDTDLVYDLIAGMIEDAQR